MKLLFATRNPHKLAELSVMLGDEAGIELVSLERFARAPDVEETGETFADNATLKATAMMRATGLPTLADDSGLEIDALGGRPGVRSARYGGPDASYTERFSMLLDELRDVPQSERTARFRCVLAFVDPDAPERVVLREGSCEGLIVDEPRGERGFGYDPLFYSPELGVTFAEAPAEDKHRVSHRGRALRAMAAYLRDAARRRREA